MAEVLLIRMWRLSLSVRKVPSVVLQVKVVRLDIGVPVFRLRLHEAKVLRPKDIKSVFEDRVF